MMLIDSHCHLDHDYYKKDLKEVIERAKKANVKFIVTNGIDYETNLQSIKIAETHPNVVKIALGYYPQDALDREYLEANKKVTKKINKKTLTPQGLSLEIIP